MRLRPNFIRESQLVERGIAKKSNTRKNHHKDHILNKKAAKKIHEPGNRQLHNTKLKQLITDADMRFQDTTGGVYKLVHALTQLEIILRDEPELRF